MYLRHRPRAELIRLLVVTVLIVSVRAGAALADATRQAEAAAAARLAAGYAGGSATAEASAVLMLDHLDTYREVLAADAQLRCQRLITCAQWLGSGRAHVRSALSLAVLAQSELSAAFTANQLVADRGLARLAAEVDAARLALDLKHRLDSARRDLYGQAWQVLLDAHAANDPERDLPPDLLGLPEFHMAETLAATLCDAGYAAVGAPTIEKVLRADDAAETLSDCLRPPTYEQRPPDPLAPRRRPRPELVEVRTRLLDGGCIVPAAMATVWPAPTTLATLATALPPAEADAGAAGIRALVAAETEAQRLDTSLKLQVGRPTVVGGLPTVLLGLAPEPSPQDIEAGLALAKEGPVMVYVLDVRTEAHVQMEAVRRVLAGGAGHRAYVVDNRLDPLPSGHRPPGGLR